MKSLPKGIPLHEPCFEGKEWAYLKECLDTGWVSSAGKHVDTFEKRISELLGVRYAIAVVNGTAALDLALKLVGVGAGDEVIVPSLTFIATANAVVYQGASPRFVEVEEATLGLDPDAVEASLKKKRAKACVVTHALGHPARVDCLVEICARFGTPLIEDAAEALGSTYRERALGSFGRLGVLSFNGNKILTTGGGGMIVTAEAKLAARARHLSTQAKSDGKAFWHDEIGYNYRMPNINAALGCAQLDRLGAFIDKKRMIARWYEEAFAPAEGLRLIREPEGARSNYWLNGVLAASPERAAAILKALNEAGVGARPLWGPCHRQKALARFRRGSLPITDRLWRSCVNLPSSANLSKSNVRSIVEIIR
jgi:perosamine synthetase